jgi:uncharacterized membrane-anchored protein YjiN (DUF445 family)
MLPETASGETRKSPPRPRRRLALIVLLGAAGAAALAFPVRATWWGGWVLATAEAGIVGGLADWFAVTALFRRPLGLPIPHTALIPANWELMAARVGTMVGDRVLTREYVTREVAQLAVADWVRRGAERVTRADLEAMTARIAGWVAGELTPGALEELVGQLRRLAAGRRVAPLLAAALDAARREGWDARAVDALARALGAAAERPAFRDTLGDLVEDLIARYRERAGAYPRFWITVAEFLGLIDRERLVEALIAGFREIARDPEHPARQELLAAIAAWPERLRRDAGLAARVEAAKTEILDSDAATELLREAATALHAALVTDLATPGSAAARFAVDRLDEARRALIADPSLRADLDRWLKRRVTELIERHHGRLASFIENGVRALGPAGAVRLIEEHAGDDLQFIRVNGTLVGGLAGGAIYAVHLLLRSW